MSNQPELVSILLCERVLQDLFRKDAVTLVNVHNQIGTQSFPTMVPVLYAYAQFKGFPENFTYQFKVEDPSGTVIAASSAGIVESLPEPAYTHKLISTFPGLVFNAPGSYNFVLEVNGVAVGSIVFQVDLVNVPQPVAV
jgi:hypothetical protein